MILILSSPSDIHARCVARELRAADHPVRFLDTRRLGEEVTVAHSIRGGVRRDDGVLRRITGPDARPLDLHQVRTIWIRRAYPADLAAVLDPDNRRFARLEWAETIDSLILHGEARTINSPQAERLATKAHQLELARHIGLRVPETLITNDPREVERFLEAHNGRVVHKAMTVRRDRLLETRRWSEADREFLSELPLAPTIFQEEIVGPCDVRVTVAGDQVFAARIATRQGGSAVDSRLDLDLRYERHDLPRTVRSAILELMEALGLLFGTVDLKITDDDQHAFFEVNPRGQFLYVEILTGLPITAGVATLLASG